MKTKLLLIVLACTALALNSCSFFVPDDDETDPVTNVKTGTNEYQQALTVLGKGVDATGKYCFVSQNIQNVFDYEALYKGGKIQMNSNISWARAESQEGTSISAYQNSFSLAISKNAGVTGLFSAETKTRFGITTAASDERQYATYNINVQQYGLYITLSNDADDMQPYLSEAFLKSVDNTDFSDSAQAEKFIAKYGTHVCMGGIWGASMAYSMSALRKSKSITTTLSRFVSGSVSAEGITVGGSVEAQDSLKLLFDESSIIANVVAIGGDAVQISDVVSLVNGRTLGSTVTTAYKAWINSVKDNPAFCDYYPGGLIGVWEVVADKTKSNQIKDAVQKYCSARGIPSVSAKKEVTASANFELRGSKNQIVRMLYGDSQMNTNDNGVTGVMINMGIEIGEDYNAYGVIYSLVFQEGGYLPNASSGNTTLGIGSPYRFKLDLASNAYGKPVWSLINQKVWNFKALLKGTIHGGFQLDEFPDSRIEYDSTSDTKVCPYVKNLNLCIDVKSGSNDQPYVYIVGSFASNVYVCI